MIQSITGTHNRSRSQARGGGGSNDIRAPGYLRTTATRNQISIKGKPQVVNKRARFRIITAGLRKLAREAYLGSLPHQGLKPGLAVSDLGSGGNRRSNRR
jgi:hypothetical protein